MVLLLATAALADDVPAAAPPPTTHTPAPQEARTVMVLMMWGGGTPFPSAAWMDGEALGCPIPCTVKMSPGEHELTVVVGKESKTSLIEVPSAARHTVSLKP
ncbi:MAG: hypothetical protein H6735_26575 [Alphaproteobacteria bacterium]|nr:hypothetical protein [Alphaproteobacteria bacterium]